MEFLLNLCTLLVWLTGQWEASTGLEHDKKLKTTYTASAAIMVDCVSWATKEHGVPVRQHGIVHTGSQSEGSVWGHVTHTQVFCRVMQEHHNSRDRH